MITLHKALTLIFGLLFLSDVMADTITTTTTTTTVAPLMVIQVVQSQVVFDNSMIASAVIVPPATPTDATYGVHVKLTAAAASQLGNLSQGNIGKQINMILNGVLISSPIMQNQLGGDFVITGLTNAEATQFVSGLPAGK